MSPKKLISIIVLIALVISIIAYILLYDTPVTYDEVSDNIFITEDHDSNPMVGLKNKDITCIYGYTEEINRDTINSISEVACYVYVSNTIWEKYISNTYPENGTIIATSAINKGGMYSEPDENGDRILYRQKIVVVYYQIWTSDSNNKTIMIGDPVLIWEEN